MTQLGRFHYTPPAPPRRETVEINASRNDAPPIVWRLPHDAAIRLQPTAEAPCSLLVAVWSCPVCETPVPRWRSPGRHRVYCTNSCRQKAYRHRCRQRQSVPMSIRRDPRPTRATTRDRVHAVREFADLSSGRRDSMRRGITACGAFARIAIDTPSRFGHVRFVGGASPPGNTCQRCDQLSGVAVSSPDVQWRQAA